MTTQTWHPALPAQQGLILDSMRSADHGVDVIQVTFDWARPLEREPFEATWRLIVQRHPILRTAFRLDGEDGLVQVVDLDGAVDIRWRAATAADRAYEEFLLADRREPFDLTRGPLFRLTVLGPARALLTFHHALIDGHSLRVLAAEISAVYGALLDGRPVPEPAGPRFADFVRWWQTTGPPAGEQQFWTDYLSHTVLPRPLPGYLGERRSGGPRTAQTVLSRAGSDLIRQAASAVGLKSSTMVTAAWALLRARYGGVSDVVLAAIRSSRRDSIPGAENIVGPLINTVPLRVRIDEDWRVRDLLTAVDDSIRRINEYQRTPLGSALGWAGLPGDTTLVDCLLMFDRRRLHTSLPAGDWAPIAARVDRLLSYPLTLFAYDEPELHLSLLWDRHRFAEGAGERMLGQLRDTLIELASDLDAPLACLDLGRAAEASIVAGWNRTGTRYPADATVPAVFAAQAARDPDAPAVVFATGTMSYGELDRRANALAWVLRRRGVRTDTPVAVAIERGPELIVALLAVLKAGGGYVPLEPGSPASRTRVMLDAAGARIALVAGGTTVPGAELIRVDDELAGEAAAPPDVAHPLSLAYISFTSGSTGVPKGVAVPQRGVIRLISDPPYLSLGPGQRVLLLSPVAFDVSTLEVWGALLTGGTVVVAPPSPLGLPDIAALLRTGGMTVVWLTAGLFHQLAEADIEALADIPVLLAGGDVLNPDTVRAVLAVRGGKPFVNGYGPTENTTFTTCQVLTDPGQVGPTVPIGRPIQHTTVHVLNRQSLGEDGRPAPIGVTGELCTGGDGLARGYTKNAAATARVFVPDPSGQGARLYRTGDLARWRADGILEFAGRADNQVKIRGFRVEPGEVEAVLRAHPGVRDSVVIVAGEGAQRHLIGYVTPADGVTAAELRPSALRDFVAQRLPDYLVPTGFRALDQLPLNPNGKVDRAALPAPERDTRGPAAAPRGGTEERLAEVWRQLLPAETGSGFGREDSFFTLGGNSLSAARLMFRIREVFAAELSMAAFYAAPTLAACAAAIDVVRQAAAPPRIGRRDRSAYRVTGLPAEPAPPQPAPQQQAAHLVPLTGRWALWRTVCLRAAGFSVGLLGALGDPALARAADAVIAGEQPELTEAEFAAAVRRKTAALHAAASLPGLREAIAWQNRRALATGIDVLVRRGPEPGTRNSKHRQHEALVASYLQRYCAKNDTIGFFGPVGWSWIDDGKGIRITHAEHPLADRRTYLEGWAVRDALAEHVPALRPWLVPRRMPFTGVDGTLLRLPLAPAVPLPPGEAAIIRACDGVRDASEVAAMVLADPSSGYRDAAEVYAVLDRLAENHRLAWRLDIAPQDIWPERTMRTVLSRVTDDGIREPAEKALAELTAARDELAAASGDAERVTAAMAGLEATFTRLAGLPPTRREGEIYAGRTLAYEECLRGDTVRLGADAFDGIRDALALVLDSARWYTTACGEFYAQQFDEIYRKRAAVLGSDAVPFADFWLLANDMLFDEHARHIAPVIRELRRRWSALIDPPPEVRRVQVRAADLRDRVASVFPERPLPWPNAVHHSPDLMIAGADAAAGGRPIWVLGEVHPSIVTIRYATWVAFHDSPGSFAAAIRHDLGGPGVWLGETGEIGGTATRLSNGLRAPGDLRLVFAHDSCGYEPAEMLRVGDCDLVSSPAGLRVRRRDGTFEASLLAVVGDLLSTVLSHCFEPVPPGAHTPRVTIDDLVVARERWTFAADDPAFAGIADERARYLRAREWAAKHGLPRHVFLRFTGERKPIYADLTSIASVDLIARALRRTRGKAGASAEVTVSEMLPAPDQAWLADAAGRRYTAELRIVAVDTRQEG